MSYAAEARQRSSRSPTDSTNNIPIPNSSPRHQNHHHLADRSSDNGRTLVSPSASRSPQPSLSSYRAHPYPPRRHSVSAAQAASSHEDASRFYLPPPNSGAPLHVPHERRDTRDRDPRDREQRNLDVRDSPQSMWHDRRPSLPRTQSERYHNHNDRGYQLPSFASITSSASSGGPVTPTSAPSGSMGPPPAALSPGLPSAALSPGGSRATSPKPYSSFGGGGLRPSYSYEGPAGSSGGAPPAPPGGRGHSLGLTIGGSGSGAPNSNYRVDQSTQNHPGSERTSPPLHAMNGYSHDQYMSTHSNHSYSSLHGGRARSHSAASALSRYGPNGTMSDGGDWAGAQTPQTPVASGGGTGPGSGGGGGGQNRRVAHLLSEQKRRESINNGFNQLRSALPDIISTDSKAVVLRKAVSYIGYLEDHLRQAGIAFGTTPANNPTGVPPPPALVRGDSGSAQGDEEENEEEEDDVEMRDTTTGVATLKVGQVPANKFRAASQGEWEHVENINGQA